jgi:hypothetical protein
MALEGGSGPAAFVAAVEDAAVVAGRVAELANPVASPADVPEAVARVASDRAFTPYSKEAQAGRKPKERK